MEHYISNSEEETGEIAKNFASKLDVGDIICLYGDIGAGKSVFARAMIRKLINNPDEDVPSPTFTLVQNYEADGMSIYHYDLYRIENPEEMWELDWDESLSESVTIVEWPEKLGYLLPEQHIRIDINPMSDKIQRSIEIRNINESEQKT